MKTFITAIILVIVNSTSAHAEPYTAATCQRTTLNRYLETTIEFNDIAANYRMKADNEEKLADKRYTFLAGFLHGQALAKLKEQTRSATAKAEAVYLSKYKRLKSRYLFAQQYLRDCASSGYFPDIKKA